MPVDSVFLLIDILILRIILLSVPKKVHFLKKIIKFFKSKSYFWNSGIFFFSAKSFLNEIRNRNEDLFIHGSLNLQIIENFEWGSLWKMLLRL